MPIFTRKDSSVEARQHVGPDLNVTSFLKGDQIAKAGDFLVVDSGAVDTLKANGATSNKGAIYVVSKADFLRDFNATDTSVTPVLKGDEELTFKTLPAVPAK